MSVIGSDIFVFGGLNEETVATTNLFKISTYSIIYDIIDILEGLFGSIAPFWAARDEISKLICKIFLFRQEVQCKTSRIHGKRAIAVF
jgi:hypothetical protein